MIFATQARRQEIAAMRTQIRHGLVTDVATLTLIEYYHRQLLAASQLEEKQVNKRLSTESLPLPTTSNTIVPARPSLRRSNTYDCLPVLLKDDNGYTAGYGQSYGKAGSKGKGKKLSTDSDSDSSSVSSTRRKRVITFISGVLSVPVKAVKARRQRSKDMRQNQSPIRRERRVEAWEAYAH